MNFLTIDTDTGKAGDDADDARPADPCFCDLAGSADPRTSGDLACAANAWRCVGLRVDKRSIADTAVRTAFGMQAATAEQGQQAGDDE